MNCYLYKNNKQDTELHAYLTLTELNLTQNNLNVEWNVREVREFYGQTGDVLDIILLI